MFILVSYLSERKDFFSSSESIIITQRRTHNRAPVMVRKKFKGMIFVLHYRHSWFLFQFLCQVCVNPSSSSFFIPSSRCFFSIMEMDNRESEKEKERKNGKKGWPCFRVFGISSAYYDEGTFFFVRTQGGRRVGSTLVEYFFVLFLLIYAFFFNFL